MFDDERPKDLITRIKYKYWEIWPHCLRPMTMWYNFKCWAWHRYSTIRCRHLPHTWSDRRTLLLHASFQILTDFIDKECSPGHVEWYGDCCHQVEVNDVMENVMDEMKELYWWWNVVHEQSYPAKCDELWEIAGECSPKMLSKPMEGMDDFVELVMEYEDDEQRDKYTAVTKEIRDLEQYMDEQSEAMLKRLAAVRLWMWT